MLSESLSSPELSVSVPRLSVLVRLGPPSSPVKLKLRSEASTSMPEDVSLPSSVPDISSGLLDRLPAKMGSCYVVQASLKLLDSSHLPASASETHWEAEAEVGDQLRQHKKTPVSIKNKKISPAWWYMPVVPATWGGAEVEGSHEPQKLRLQ
ncbi:hypothetical protein AAY473_038424 [Plecturocebus cupreus]